MFKISLTIEAGYIPQGEHMKDWLRDEIETVKARCARAERKLDRRLLDDKVKQEQRPGTWAALVAEVKGSVTLFNESVDSANALKFSERDQRISVSKDSYPKAYLHVEFREETNEIISGFKRTEHLNAAAVDVPSTITFDVDDNGNLILLSGNTSQTIDEVVAMMLRPVFQCVC